MLKKIPVLLGCCVLALVLTACSEPKQEGPDYADDEAMQIIADGYEKRADVIFAQELPTDDTEQKNNYREAVEAEQSVSESLKDRQFEDSKLQEKVIAYLNTLDDSIDVLESYSMAGGDFYIEWQKVYDERTSILKDFADNYGLEVGPKYQESFEELLVNGKEATEKAKVREAIEGLVAAAAWEKVDEGYGSFTYTTVIENTSEFDFKDVSIVLALYDADGVKAEEAYASTQNWARGEKVKFEGFSQTDAAEVKASVEYYMTAE